MAVNKRNSGTKARANAKSTPATDAGTKKKKARTTGYISDLDCYLFGAGTHYDIYQKLGAHPRTYKGKDGIYFAVWAPHAREVHLVGDFNGWNPEANPMVKIPDSGIWEYFNAGMKVGELYKFAITTESGKILYKADPFAFSAEYRPGTASVTTDIEGFNWTDSDWVTKRTAQDVQKLPMSIYEVHLGSWRKKNREEKDGFYTYSEAAHELAAYVKEMGYTHVELMGIAEHPFDGSWGYQVTGYFAPTSRYGSPKDFMYFVNYLHRAGIGVILDWVPAHFPKDAHGLADFDGQPLFEYADPRKGEHPDWGTKVFDYGKNEVKDFLISNALYWVEQYHVDGLRVDAVASMLYLDYGRQEGQWVPNKDGGNQNLEAIEFFKHLNTVVQGRNHGALVIAEESTAWPKVTTHPEQDGLGFTFKWNMGWMHDFLEYMKLDPYFRKYNHHRMTFGLTYFTSENYILVLSHDEVVHLKCSMINKMPGLGEDKFANLKAGYTFMMGHPGKKLLFMGQDFGQLHEWDEKVSLDWYLADQDDHKDLQDYVKDLLHLYKKYPALYRQDNDWNGFQWINANDADRSIFSFLRRDETGKKNLLFIINFTPVERPDYRVGVPKRGKYTLLLDSTHGAYKASEAPGFSSAKGECDGQPYSFSYPLPAYGTAIFRF
ncbi:1,4-alpha-glucan branching protein GlgB [Lachnoclostridium pacaense]|uniref:1,4-alpha-glucan branching protein GlgB n=1 Tax=Enterocloster hominis (ex Hitch et al. 2024) TaxID=1917870 RepID=UPI001D115BF0|nr:1,4-alpha-glucan branching protein GlgB [Lachnoclostridium pacaense]MCC2820309.1 1,4-alpha-glucan branching protein GlgB [Lachnoclostridium pacaense]